MELGKDRRVIIQLGFTDMRKQTNGLAAIVQELRPEGCSTEAILCSSERQSAS